MSGILSIAYSGLNAFQRALNVTGNNIANATTRGYSRQTIQLVSNVTQRFGNSYLGNGVGIGTISRNADQFVNNQVRSSLSVKSQYESFYNQGLQIDKLLSQEGTSLSSSLHSFFDSLSQLNNDPASLTSRNVVLSQSRLLAGQFNTLQQKLDDYQHNSTQQISEALKQINQITQSIAALNEEIVASPNDLGLLDNRDELLNQLSQFTQITVMPAENGTVTVSLTGGDTLVVGTAQRNLQIGDASGNAYGTKVSLGDSSAQLDVTNRLSGGMLGGLLDYEHNVIGQASQSIGQMAIGLSQTFNAQHQLGMDMNNLLGLNFFTDYNSAQQQLDRVKPNPTNAGSAVLSVSIDAVSQTKLSDYSLLVSDLSSNEVRLIRNSDGVSTTLHWNSNPPAPPAGQLTIDGMTIQVDDISHLAEADSFSLSPTRGAARSFAVEINDTKQIAFASPVTTSASSSNTGLGQIALGKVFNTNAVANQYRIHFITPTQYSVDNLTDSTTSGPFTFVPNDNNTVSIPDSLNPSYSVILSGLPQAGDEFTSEYNAGGVTDNRNGLNLAGLQQSKVLSGGTASLFDSYASLLSEVGSQVNQAGTRYQSADILYQSATSLKQSQSGVNLDEEAANLLYFQKAYEAAGKLMQVSNEMMDTLFQMLR